MNENNKQLINKQRLENCLSFTHSFEAETRLSIAPEHKLKPLIGTIPTTYHPIRDYDNLKISPNHKYIALQRGKKIYLMHENTKKVFQTIPLDDFKASFVFTPNSKKIITADDEGKIAIWEIRSGFCQKIIKTNNKNIKKLYISKEGEKLIFEGLTIDIYDIKTGTQLASHDNRGYITLGFGPDHQSIIRYMKYSDVLEVIDTYNGNLLKSYDITSIHNAVLSSDHTKVLITHTVYKEKIIINLITDQIKEIPINWKLNDHQSRILLGSIAINSSEKKLILCNEKQYDKQLIEYWDLDNFQKKEIIGDWKDLKLSPDEKMFYAKEVKTGIYFFWDITNGEKLFEITPHIYRHNYKPIISNTQKFLITSGYEESATIWNLKNGDHHHDLIGHMDIFPIDNFSKNDKLLLTHPKGSKLYLWDMQTGICLQKWDKYYFKGSALSPNGHIITYIIGKEITVENIFDQSFLYKIQTNYEGWRSELKFSHDNKYLHYIFLDSTHNILSYIIYHAESGTQIEKYQHQIEIHSEIEYEVDFNRSSLYIIENGKIIQLNIKTREVIKPFSGPSEEFDHFPIKSMAHDPNGKWLAGTYLGSHLALWKMDGDGKPQFIIDTRAINPSGIENLAFMNDQTIMIANKDGQITFWNIKQKTILAKLFPLKKGYLWTTPPDEFALNGWLHTNRPDLISLATIDQNEEIVEHISEDDQRFQDYMQMYNDQEMVMTRLNDFDRYQELLDIRIGNQKRTSQMLLKEHNPIKLLIDGTPIHNEKADGNE